MPLTDTPVWSKSQVSAFQECERKHALSTWMNEPSAETDARWTEVRRLKALSSRHLWPGATVHDEIGEVLKTVRQGEPAPSIEDWLDRVRNKMRDQFRDSKNGPQSNFRFFEHEYNLTLSKEIWAETWTKVETCLRRFHGSAWLTRLREIGPECWKTVDEVVSFSVGDIKAYLKIDCAVETDGKFTIMDWKTSALKAGDDIGLRTAALYAHEVWGADPSMTDVIAVSLIDGRTQRLSVDEEMLMETHLRIEEEASSFAGRDRSADPFSYPLASRRQTCERCNFKQLCFPKEAARAF